MMISAIVAMSENRVIGKDNQLPWRLPADLKHFKSITMGKPIIMGRKTYESIGRILPGRKNIIITRKKDFHLQDAVVVHSVEAAIQSVEEVHEVMIIGGSEIFQSLFPQTQRIYRTVVHSVIDGDSYFPELKPKEWKRISCEDHKADAENEYDYSFEVWEKV